MIARWAPSSENPTDVYVQNVCSAMGVKPIDQVNLSASPALFQDMICAIIQQENGEQPYPVETIQAAIASAEES